MQKMNYKEVWESCPSPKCKYNAFRQRILLGWKVEDARVPGYHRNEKPKYDDSGRYCTKCKEYKVWEHYGTDNTSRTKHRTICKQCEADKMAKYYKQRAEKIKNNPNWKPRKCKKEITYDKPVIGDNTCCDAVLDVICRIGLLPPKKEEGEIGD